MRIDDVVIQELAGFIDNRDLAAGANAGVDRKNCDRPGGRREQQVIEIVAENFDGFGVGSLLQFEANFGLDRGIQQALPGVLNGEFKLRRPVAGRCRTCRFR